MSDLNKDLAAQFRATTVDLTELIGKFGHETFNRKPINGGWSAGEVAEHLLIFDIRLNLILEDATHPTDRALDEQLAVFTPRVSNRENKIEAPPFLVPSPGIKSVATLVEQIKEERNTIYKAIEENDLSLHSKKYPHRFFGDMTAYEWLNLIDVHTKRHMEQLNELLAV